MIIALTGTPGTGKTTVCEIIRQQCGNNILLIDLNRLVMNEGIHFGKDNTRNSYSVDMEKLEHHVDRIINRSKDDAHIVMEGHISHLLHPDAVIVLRVSPRVLEKRLLTRTNYSKEKIKENLEAEALDVILVEAVEINNRVFEIDTTNKKIQDVADSIITIIRSLKEGKNPEEFLPGKIDWIDQVEI